MRCGVRCPKNKIFEGFLHFVSQQNVKLSNNLDSNNLYASFPLINHAYRHYVGKVGSGAGFWLSRDNVEYILSSNIIEYIII